MVLWLWVLDEGKQTYVETNSQEGQEDMKCVSIVGACLAVMLTGALGISPADAAKPEFTAVKGTFPFHFEGNNSEGKITTVAGTTITCAKVYTLGLILNGHLGDFLTLYLLCKGPLSSVCTTPGMLAGHIHVRGTFHLGLAMKGAEEPHAIYFAMEEAKFSCTGIPVALRGGVIGKITEPAPVLGKPTTKLQLTFKQTGGSQEFTEFLLGPLEGLMTKADLELSINGGAFELTGWEDTSSFGLLSGTEIEIK